MSFRKLSIGGTQSPPLEDCHPMGACSIKGGNAGGIPDRQQRSDYFDLPEKEQEQEEQEHDRVQSTAVQGEALRGGTQGATSSDK
ncbi:hypothetical protein F5148DRAFT_1376434 [Russula earlei]|uniref:Uncharacterized protein n=1 Tax=Russula earlei TaxID=71964 RepID=A0ACC0U7G4_9AGAM|nr:hypothetical protein F5148DRAFT_1376434 [Russula earlei]